MNLSTKQHRDFKLMNCHVHGFYWGPKDMEFKPCNVCRYGDPGDAIPVSEGMLSVVFRELATQARTIAHHHDYQSIWEDIRERALAWGCNDVVRYASAMETGTSEDQRRAEEYLSQFTGRMWFDDHRDKLPPYDKEDQA